MIGLQKKEKDFEKIVEAIHMFKETMVRSALKPYSPIVASLFIIETVIYWLVVYIFQ